MTKCQKGQSDAVQEESGILSTLNPMPEKRVRKTVRI